MDEREFKSTYAEVNDRPCVFGKAILRRCCACSRAQRVYIAEREAVACKSPGAHQRCADLYSHLKRNATFALRQTQVEGPLPHGKEMKVECGGLIGMQHTSGIEPEDPHYVSDVFAMVEQVLQRHGHLDEVPYTEVVKSITTYQPRRRRGQ